MKKKILCLLTLMAMGGSVMAGDKPVITVADVEALPGETVSFAVNLTDGKANTYTAMTLYAYFPTTGFTTTGTYTVSSTWTGASGSVGDINTTTGLATIPFASANAIPGSAVDNLVTVSFTVGNSVAVGEYPVTLKGTMFEYNSSDKDYADDVTFKVKVVNAHTVVLDELSTTAPENATGVNVTVKRTIKADEWSTICLPFAMTNAQLKTAFGDDVKLAEFDGTVPVYDGDNCTDIQVSFTEATAIEANHPYAIKVTSPITSFTVENVSIEVEDEPSVDKDELKQKIGGKWYYFYNSFKGTYVAQTEVPENCLFLSENKFWYSTGLTKMKGFRGYFEFLDILSDVENASARISFNFDNETTGIHSIDNLTISPIDNGPMYNLAGQRVNKSYKGIVIQNGVKRVIK